MTTRSDVPFNVSILELTPAKLQNLRPVRVLDILDGATQNFHPEGLFSTEIFGRVGDPNRNKRFSYINIKVPIFHPAIFSALVGLKRLYGGIIAGTEYAVWDASLQDFEKSNAADGETGFAFFVKHWKDIKFTDTKSVSREQAIQLISKYQDKAMTDKVVVIPAGLRDCELVNGRIKEEEINIYYRKLLAISNSVNEIAVKNNPEVLNSARYGLQTTFNELFEYLESLIEGKKKLLLGRWASRRIFNGTRNVITAMDTGVPVLGEVGQPGFNSTIMGLYQAMKSVLPVARYHLRNGFLQTVFPGLNMPVRLVNKKTLMGEEINLKTQYFDRWMTDEGLEKVITSFEDVSVRHKPIEIEGRYLGLIYKGPDMTFRLMHSVDELPETRSREHVYPLTFVELLYLSVFHVINKYPVFVTRYPITGIGSIYPSKMYVKTTVESERRQELGPDWHPLGEDRLAVQFPVPDGAFVNSLVPHSSKLGGLGADFDGDTSSGNTAYSDNAVAEVDRYLKTKRAYVGVDGNFMASTSVDTINLVMFNLTGE